MAVWRSTPDRKTPCFRRRPDYQIPRFAKGKAARTGELALGEAVVVIAAGRPMSAAEIARCFKRGGRRIEPRVEQALTVLARYGHVSALEGGLFAARRAA
ncbi:hypothetical protein VSX64_19830 [Aurantimonas sp. C2-6-R+9]|uniref:hypothetical protein n=1 Tax=unclassified Aurantimonas TaxID=2638230 RepID=UPI002E19E88D|nr:MULTISPECIES: hypothetical protein [unclassified Aurantimonas]MEC5293558.1 hypothetical protein [Aurantimonas sp. C2-3-R2]MEC5325453.1 hypothetical protein [Aurantimonas sp. A3-2-R12]MEC5383082.1 hypothetical protein [Aurantimonas sp. C2-6-R+9]MEC5414629.1 hypothetical protein [Aurantimonas sp. C2-4-R8]